MAVIVQRLTLFDLDDTLVDLDEAITSPQFQREPEAAPNEEVTADQMRGVPEPAAEMVSGAVGEYEEKTSLEAICARDADKLECLIQAIEYREQGRQNVQPWIDSSLAALKTASAKRLADEALSTGSLEWMNRVLNGD
ncbi:HD domain-containing protein [Streptosporangium sp. NPDC023963]|uniref:HD domain-containing protein n=1 Tax=Streptosporangium sp. NPDC023963 TaxID=3155608 RepID=UPI00342E5DC7